MKQNKRLRRNSMLRQLLLPIMAAMLVQALLHLFIFWQGGVVTNANQNAYDILNERVVNRKQYIENEMLHKWSNIEETESRILMSIAAVLKDNGATYEDISQDGALNEKIVSAVVPDLIYMLRRNSVTGAFLVLDGPGTYSKSETLRRAGFYLRDLDPISYAKDNSDLLAERGMPATAKAEGITLDALWSPAFDFSWEGSLASEQFFFQPLLAARGNENKQSANYGYWSECFALSETDMNVITYSIPLIGEDGTVFGVMGVDITEQYLYSMLKYQEISQERNGAYVLAVTKDGGQSFTRVFSNGPLYLHAFGGADEIRTVSVTAENIYNFQIPAENRATVWGSVQNLKLYNANTPFVGQQWVLLGLVQKATLHAFSNKITVFAEFAALVSLALGLVAVYTASRMATRPITALVTDLGKHDPNRPIILKKLAIKEIDELTDSIESMSRAVAESSSRISKILSLTKASIGVFEYGPEDKTVFCSGNLFAILGWPAPPKDDLDYCLLDRGQFEEWMLLIENNHATEAANVYQLCPENGPERWINISVTEDLGKILGAVTDVTEDVLIKKKIEYERDYDILTNLYNRRAFLQKAEALFAGGALKTAALIMWDLDNLKYINDTYGHDYGDKYITSLSECLKCYSALGGITARRSGDEFYTLLYGYDTVEEARSVIWNGWEQIEKRMFRLPNGVEYRIRVSAGIAWYPNDTTDFDELVRFADFAMYQSKHTIKGTLSEFNHVAFHESAALLYGSEALNQLFDHELVRFALQPIVTVATGDVYGYELLMRPEVEGLKTPLDVMRIAQAESKLYHVERLTWMKGMETFVNLAEQGKIGAMQRVFVNSISSQCMTMEHISEFEARYKKYLQRVVLEIMESDPGNSKFTAQKMNILESWGGLIAIDDYGTGYNSEASLIFVCPDIVKLDISIVRDIDKDATRQKLLVNLLSYIRSRNAAILAEGVETEAEMRTLVSFGIDYIQGYYTGRPDFDIHSIDPEVTAAIRDAYKKKGLPVKWRPV